MAFLILDIETVPRPSIDETMDIACRSFGIPSPKRGDVTGDTVAKAYEEGNIPAVEEYVMRDVEATHNLFEKLKGYII